MPDALQMLKEDHRRVQEIFKRFEQTDDLQEKKQLVDQALMELDIHTTIEEEIFYPAVREEAGPEGEIMEEAEEEHHVAEMIMGELRGMQPRSANFSAKFMVLAENVKHHIQEEESQMLPKAAELGSERLQELGMEMEERKMQLMESGSRRRARGGSGSRGRTSRAGSRGGARGGTRTGSRNGGSRSRTTRGAARGSSNSRSRSRASSRSSSGGTTRARSGSSARGGSTSTRGSGASTRSRTSRTARGGARSSGAGARGTRRSTRSRG